MATYRIVVGDQKQYGPVSPDELRQWIAEGRLDGQSLVLAKGDTDWKPLGSFPEFSEALLSQSNSRAPVSAAPAKPAEWTNQVFVREPVLRVGTDLVLPGFGSLMAGRAMGYVQAAITMAGFGLTMLFGVKFVVWYLANWSVINSADADPLETLTNVWQQVRWALLGIALFAVAWLWALATNATTLRRSLRSADKPKPPKLN